MVILCSTLCDVHFYFLAAFKIVSLSRSYLAVYDVLLCGFSSVYLTLSLLSFLELQVTVFIKFRNNLTSVSFKFFSVTPSWHSSYVH